MLPMTGEKRYGNYPVESLHWRMAIALRPGYIADASISHVDRHSYFLVLNRRLKTQYYLKVTAQGFMFLHLYQIVSKA